ncbi:MAG: hypothetical protein ABIH24_02925 [Verrucomicrobiota bacterium]
MSCASRVIICCFLFGLMAQFNPASAISVYRYHGGSYNGSDCRQGSPLMYGGGIGNGSSMNISSNFIPGTPPIPARLRFVGQPPPTNSVNKPFSWDAPVEPLSVEVLDENGFRYTYLVFTITLALDNDPAGGSTLGGTLTADTISGLASFETNNLSIDKAGVGFTIEATTTGLLPGISDAFSVLEPFTITTPTAGTAWHAGRTYNIVWQTFSGATAVNIYYAIVPDIDTWYPIASSVANNNSYSWTVPNVLSQTAPLTNMLIKVADAANSHLYDISDEFSISLYQITFRFFDIDTGAEIDDLDVACSSGWTGSQLASGVTRYYPYATNTTIFLKATYYASKLTGWVSDSNKTTMLNFVPLSRSDGTFEYNVRANMTHEGDECTINAWLDESGTVRLGTENCRVSLLAADGSELASASQASPDAEGFFRMPIDITNITKNDVYLTKIRIDYAGSTYFSAMEFALYIFVADLSRLYDEHAAILSNTAAISSNTMWLGTSYDALSASYNSLNPKLDTLGIKMDASLAGMDSIKTAVGASESETLYSKASQTRDLVAELPTAITREAKKGIQSKILNRPTTATNGCVVTIRYKTDTGKVPEISVYDPDNTTLISGGLMANEIGASGVYEYALEILSTWALGEYTIICSESTTASADSMTLKVVASEEITGDFSSVLEKLNALGVQLDGVAADQSAMNSTLSSVAADQSAMNSTLTTMSGDISTIKTDIAAINATLQTISDDVNTLLENWDSLNMTELKSNIDLLVKYMGTPNDSSGMQTLFGKIALTYGLVNQMPVAAVFAEVQALRKEVDFQGKSDTTYSMLADISAAIDDLQATGTEKTKEITTELLEASKTVQETRETISAIAKQAGVGGVLAVSAGGGKELSLQSLYDQMAELKAISQAILDLLRQREKPVVKTWLESGSVKQRILVANHSKTVEEVVPVKEYLPDGVKPEDIISKGDFKLGYDFDRSLYFVYQNIKLQPDASVTLEVVMNDIWRIDDGEINMLRDHVKRLSAILEKSRYAEQVKILRDSIYRRFDQIIQNQNTVTTTENRLSNYEMNKAALDDTKKDIGVMEDLVVEVQGLPTDKIMGEISPVASAAAGALPAPKRKITMKIEMVNPLAISNTAPLEYPLPAEIKPDLITDRGGLEVRYNPEKKIHYLSAANLAFAPYEKKNFSVELNDVWYIPNEQINDLSKHTEKLVGMFTDSEARPSAEFLGKRIMQELAAIDKAQQQKDLTADVHIGNYRVNAKRMEDVKKDIARLERLIVQTGGTPGLTMAVRDAKIKEGGVIPAAGSKARTLGTVNTWRIIWTTIAFTGIISFLFFMIWWMQIKKKDSVKLEKLDTAEKDKK